MFIKKHKTGLAIFLILISLIGKAQFYNGSNVTFGKNRVQFSGYLWSHFDYEQYSIYFYEEGKNIADYIARSAHLQIREFENLFEHKMSSKIQLIAYNTQNQSRESNIGNYLDEELNPGGFARITGNKIFLYFNGSHKNLDQQLRNGIAQVILNEVIYGEGLTDELKNSALISLQDWFYNGLISYLTQKWSVEIEDEVKSYFNAGKLKNINWLSPNEATLAGHSIWYYIADVYGEAAVINTLYMAKVNRNSADGILYILGKSSEDLIEDWKNYFKSRFIEDNVNRTKLSGKNPLKYKAKKNTVYQRFQLNANNDYAAYTTNKLSQQKVFIQPLKKGKRKKCILKLGHKIDVEPDYSFPVILWHPNGQELTVFYEHKGELIWMVYNVETKKKVKSKLFFFEKILDANYSYNGQKIVLSGVVKGKTDIYVLDVQSRAPEQITNDFFDDRYPVFMNGTDKIVFSSNRDNDTMSVRGNKNFIYPHKTDLFVFDYKNKKSFKYTPQVLFKLTNTPHVNEKQPVSIGTNTIQYLSDWNGIYNVWNLKIDSAVAFIDTTIHYRFFTKTYPVTNYAHNIKWMSNNGKNTSLIFKPTSRYLLQYKTTPTEPTSNPFTYFKSHQKKDTINIPNPEDQSETLVLTIDSLKRKITSNPDFFYPDYYIFSDEMEKENNDSVIKVVKDNSNTAFQPLVVNGFPTSDSLATSVKMRNYELLFKTAEISLDLDNRFLNPQYQRFSGGGSYPMPGMNGFMKYAVVDLLEDYLVTGGFRIADLFSNEVFLSFEDRKKRLDKQYLFYRGTNTDLDEPSVSNKLITYEGIYRLNYPFSIVDRVSATFSLRYDQSLPLSRSIDLLEEKINHEFWPNIRLDYTFDNTRALGTNLYSGTRFKIFSEYYQEAPNWEKQMFTYGADFRHYIQIHRSLIWANRLAGGSSLGSQRLMYYLGGVDSWTVPKFNNQLTPGELPNNDQYAFQTLGTNMRGFKQNIRNGSSFIALNSEIRWPVVKYLFAQPFASEFLNNFQMLFFGDVGTAWAGNNPFSKSNSLNERNIPLGGEANTGEIILRTNKEPIVGGYGFGLRTTIMGYFLRADWAWGVEDGVNQGRQFYLSLTTDF